MTTTSLRIAFIGGGNMAAALIGGLIKNGAQAQDILAIDPMQATRDNLVKNFQIQVASDCDAAKAFLAASDLVIFAIKPQQFFEAATQFKSALNGPATPLILSIAAGIRIEDMVRWVGYDRIVRAMPNTPALISKGVTGLCANKSISASDRRNVELACQAVGSYTWVDTENLIDAVTAVSGSGPAYVFAFLEALQAAGVNQGLNNEQAKLLAIETLVGAAMLAANSEDSPTTLREKVTSKGGTTFAALEVLREKQWGSILNEAIDAAAKRGAEMGQEFGKTN
jgi:pyrroline-5-carboxylate reductase